MGAWIEMERALSAKHERGVAPLVGAWIEILMSKVCTDAGFLSLPSWERGLK